MTLNEDLGRLERELELLCSLSRDYESIKLIPNFKNYNKITLKAYEFIEELLNTHHAYQTLAQAYGLLNIDEKKFLNPLKDPDDITEEVLEHVRSFLVEEILQYGFVKCIVGFTCSKSKIALS